VPFYLALSDLPSIPSHPELICLIPRMEAHRDFIQHQEKQVRNRHQSIVSSATSASLMVSNLVIDDNHYPPGAAPAQQEVQPGESDFSDGSGSLFSMYLERAEEEDRKSAESWKGDADGILVFVRLCMYLQGF
jgi:hypothetical protein